MALGTKRDRAVSWLDYLQLHFDDLPQPERRLIQRHRLAMWTIAIGVWTVAEALDQAALPLPDEALRRYLPRAVTLVAIVIAVSIASRVVLNQWIRRVREREAARIVRERAERLEGALMAARTMEHHLGNQLALTMGYSEILARNPLLPPPARDAAEHALKGVRQATETLDKLQRVIRLEADDSLGVPIVDLSKQGP